MFRRMFEALIEARQKSVNREIARYLQREYPHETQDWIVENVLRG